MAIAQLLSHRNRCPALTYHTGGGCGTRGQVFAPRMADFDRLAGLFLNTGIRERRAARPIEWYLKPQGWPERSAAYVEVAGDAVRRGARRALDKAGLTAGEVDAVVTVSSTGMATPSLEAGAATDWAFAPEVSRVPVFGLGCAGGVTGLSIASRLAAARPGANVLLVVVELCTLRQARQGRQGEIVAVALFGDGAAACVLRSGEAGFSPSRGRASEPGRARSTSWAGRSIREGFGVIFAEPSRLSPRSNLAPAVDGILGGRASTVATSTASSAIRAAPRWSAAIERPCDLQTGLARS